jgi:uncharacterized protein YbjT (DUF2867 family)
MKIAITGATGQVGKELAFLLQEENTANQLLVRNPERAAFLQHKTSRIVPFDFNKSETYENALKDVDKLFLVCDSSIGESAISAFLNAAQHRGIKKIILISGIGADKIKTHFLAKLEALVKESEIPFIALRANWFFQNFGTYFRDMIVDKHELSFPDGRKPISFVDTRDIAEVASYLLIKPVEDLKLGYDITGPESLSHEAVAQLFSNYLGYPVAYKELSEQEAKDKLDWDDEWLNLFRDIRNGITSPVSNSVEKILGKPSRRLQDYIKENISLWKTIK